MKNCFVYIMANDNRTIYIGVTSDLPKRVYQHREKLAEGFTKTYGLDRLVYWKLCGTPGAVLEHFLFNLMPFRRGTRNVFLGGTEGRHETCSKFRYRKSLLKSG